MDCIKMVGIDVYAHHGALPAEKELGQRFVIDLELWSNLSKAAETDDLNYALDYTQVHEKVLQVAAGQTCNLIESLANSICVKLLAEFNLDKVSVTVHKPNPPISNFLGSVSVTVEKTRPNNNSVTED